MVEIGYKLSCEEHGGRDLVRNAVVAEQVGFSYGLISDHYHPWIDRQGHSPFVWAVIGGISHATDKFRLGTGVTCPLIRVHPAIIAQAAATAAEMMPGRFFLGVGTGENLNEHILADRWPPIDVRLEMLEEAIEVIRKLWQGKQVDHRGRHYSVENARIYTLPPELPAIYVAASGKKSTSLAGKIGDGLIGVAAKPETVQNFMSSGGAGKPKYAECHVCWGEEEGKALKTAHEWWPNIAMKGQLGQELALPAHFEQTAQMVTEEDVGEVVAYGPDPERHLGTIQKFVDAGYDHVTVHQIGPDQEGFFRFYEREILPKL